MKGIMGPRIMLLCLLRPKVTQCGVAKNQANLAKNGEQMWKIHMCTIQRDAEALCIGSSREVSYLNLTQGYMFESQHT